MTIQSRQNNGAKLAVSLTQSLANVEGFYIQTRHMYLPHAEQAQVHLASGLCVNGFGGAASATINRSVLMRQ